MTPPVQCQLVSATVQADLILSNTNVAEAHVPWISCVSPSTRSFEEIEGDPEPNRIPE